MFQSVRMKLTILLVSTFLILYAITAGTIYILMDRLTINNEVSLLQSSAKPLSTQVSLAFNQGRFPQEFVDIRALVHLFPRLSDVVLRDAMGQTLADTNYRISKNLPYSYSQFTQVLYLPNAKRWIRLLTIHLTNTYGQRVGGLQLALDITEDLATLARLRDVIWEVGVAGAIVAILIGFYVSNRALQPISRSWGRQQQFVADASHELRTPLSVIQANLDIVLTHGNESVLDNMEWLSNAREEIARLTKLTVDLLTLARVDSNQPLLRIQDVDIRQIVNEIGETFQVIAEMKGVRLDWNIASESARDAYQIKADPDRLRQLLVILVDNAIKYTPEQGLVQVSLERHRQTLRFCVKDNGIGISPRDLARIFNRFYRSDQARNRSDSGAGLGLAIAKWIVKEHKGKMTVTSSLGQGSNFEVMLPVRLR